MLEKLYRLLLLYFIFVFFAHAGAGTPIPADSKDEVQALVSFTVSESKRLIAKAVAEMSPVQAALKKGLVIVAKGTTNTFVAEELSGQEIEKGAYVYGKVYPRKGGQRLEPDSILSELIFMDGKIQENLSMEQALQDLKVGDVVIKGGNALDYPNRLAAVYIGSGSGGTTGKFMPYVVARKAHLIIPIGLEKAIAGNIIEVVKRMRDPIKSLNSVPSMWLLDGTIVTEIEAFQILANVEATHVSGGGIGGAEGAVRLLLRGSRKDVLRALSIADEIYGEPPFVE
jgi:hypothetical protein